jgi:hypothetical protein
VNEAKALEAYFIRHGASTQLMSALFKLRRKLTLEARAEISTRAGLPGRVPLPDYATRERIYQAWRAIGDPAPRVRYYRLHQAFTHLPIAVLEAVVRRFRGRRMNARMESLRHHRRSCCSRSSTSRSASAVASCRSPAV